MTSPTSYPPAVTPARHPTIASELVPDRRGAVAFLSHTRRDADWILPRLFRTVAFWGNVELDLTRALLGAGTSEIEVKCIMSSVQITVPPGIRVECDVDSVLGSAEVQRGSETIRAPDAPTVRITGTAFLGSVDVKIVDPNAPGLLEKLRRRFAK